MAEKNFQNDKPDKNDDLLKRLENSMDQIEIEEMLKGFSKEELEEKGFIGEKEIALNRIKFSETTEREKLTFQEGIEYKRLSDSEQFSSLTIDSFLSIRDIIEGALIATREPKETIPFFAGKNVLKIDNENGERYIAKVKGKVLIIKDTLYVFSSNIDCKLNIKVSVNKMRATMNCEAGYGLGKQLSLEMILEELKRQGVIHGILNDSIKKAIADAEELRTPQKDIVIAEGTLPIRGEDAKIECQVEMDSPERTFSILPDGRVDYKGAANIAIAQKNQLLVIIKDPGVGTNGINVLGELTPPEKGKDVSLVAGNGVRASEDGKSFYAEIKGCIMLNPPVLEVLDLYVVKGDVDYATGSINFNGNVVINGSVREGFEVKADGDIVVQNCVESARVVAGRDVRISGGVIGQGKGLISAGRDVYVEYIQNGRVEAHGNVYVNDFTVNSYIFCNFLDMKKKHGSIVGGEAYSQRGIDVLNCGSPSGTKTHVTTGTDFLVRRKIKELDEVIKFCVGNIMKIDTILNPILKQLKSDPDNPKYKTPIIKKTLEKRKELYTQKRVMDAKRDHLYTQLEVEGVCFIKVKNTCYADVYVSIKHLKMVMTEKRENSLFYEDTKEEKIKIGPY